MLDDHQFENLAELAVQLLDHRDAPTRNPSFKDIPLQDISLKITLKVTSLNAEFGEEVVL